VQEQRQAEARATAEKERVAAAARAKAEAEARDQARRQAELMASMEAEEGLLAAQNSGELSRYLALIQQRVERNWVPPATVQEGLECEVAVQQLPNGDVVDARTVSCNGDAAVQRSVENAVRRSSPLPLPDNRALFERNLRFIFKPQQ
jgi:colicin import membrane protein